ncbi:hypothetical protein SDC9_132155 [bioreactor metagenome]|uniref:Uncharacterized protein n=1 Tax=bioreactor metagenome TaxID=1076179 RepID=A0A645D7P4_9ZZZZ
MLHLQRIAPGLIRCTPQHLAAVTAEFTRGPQMVVVIVTDAPVRQTNNVICQIMRCCFSRDRVVIGGGCECPADFVQRCLLQLPHLCFKCVDAFARLPFNCRIISVLLVRIQLNGMAHWQGVALCVLS